MNLGNLENTLKEACLHQLREYLRNRTVVGTPLAGTTDLGYDLIVPLEGKPTEHLLVQFKKTARIAKAQIHHFLAGATRATKGRKGHLTLWAPWIPDEMGKLLREAHIFYTDAVGNAYLDLPRHKLLIDVRGRMPERKPQADRGRLVEPTGLMVLHHLLTHRDAVKDPYRTIAQQAGVALGTVAVVMRELEEIGHLTEQGRNLRRLQRKPELIDLFVKGYALKLRPECLIGTYRHEIKPPQQLHEKLLNILEPLGIDVAATGAVAAEDWTGYLRADTVTLFVGEQAWPILGRERMLPDAEGGNLTLLRYFGPTIQDPNDKARRLATPLLVYAELLNVGRPRETEAARMIFDRYIQEETLEP